MSFAQGAPTQLLSLVASNVFVSGSSTTGNAFTVQQLSTGNVASFVTSTGATSLFINPSGQVGIGKTNPSYAMDITGDLNFTGTFRQNGIPYIGSQWTGTSTLYFVGNVGINTTSVANPLTVGGTVVATTLNLTNALGTAYGGTGITSFTSGGLLYASSTSALASSGAYTAGQVLYGGGAGAAPGSSSGLFWDSTNSRLGIGTNNPSKLLHVWGGLIIGASSDSRATTVTLNAPGATATFSPNSDIGDGARIMCLQCPDLSSTTANLVSFSLQVAPTGTFGSQRTSLDLKGFRVASQSYGGFCITSPFDTAGSYDLFYADRTKAYFQQNVGIGTASPTQPLDVNGAARVRGNIYNADGTQGYVQLNTGITTIPGYLAFYKADNTRVGYIGWQYDSVNLVLQVENGYTGYVVNSKLGVKVAPGSYDLQVAGTIGASGDITALYSDERLKTKTGALENALDKVASLDTFTYRNNELAQSFGFKDDYQRVGVSAQQVHKVLPEAVRPAPFDAENQSGQNYLTVQYDKLVPLLIEALKEERSERLRVQDRLERLERLLSQDHTQ